MTRRFQPYRISDRHPWRARFIRLAQAVGWVLVIAAGTYLCLAWR